MSVTPGDLLLRRCFTADLQTALGRLSGDFNPVHADPVAARRTIAGGQVVHGIHQVLAVMEAVLALEQERGLPIRAITGFTVLFKRQIMVGETVEFYLTELSPASSQVEGRVREDSGFLITMRRGDLGEPLQIELPPLRVEPVAELRFDDLAGKAGDLELGLDATLARELFPFVTGSLGALGVAQALSLSRLVGMHCPGLNSLSSQYTVNFRTPTRLAPLHYRVTQTDERFGKLVMQVDGPGIEGQITAFYRPSPEQQPAMAEVQRLVPPGTFADCVALIVGGSRGLGEVTARVIAAGGGRPIITYHQGLADAERIADDIRAAGGRCEVLQLDVRQIGTFAHQLSQTNLTPRSLYYFATPKIFGRRSGFFDYGLLDEFQKAYVTAFGRLLDVLASSSATRLRVFYPSSVAVEGSLREMAEFAMAKRAGEELCAFYNRQSKQVEIIVERLPRIRTDQTSALLPVPAEEALEVMVPLVRRVESAPSSNE